VPQSSDTHLKFSTEPLRRSGGIVIGGSFQIVLSMPTAEVAGAAHLAENSLVDPV